MKKLIVAVLSLFMLSGPVLAEGDLNSFLERAMKEKPDEVAVAYILGIHSGIQWRWAYRLNRKMDTEGSLDHMCLPMDYHPQASDIFVMLDEAIRNDPEIGTGLAGGGVVLAMQRKFGCGCEGGYCCKPGETCDWASSG